MYVHQSQLIISPFIHDNLFRTCQGRMKGVNLITFISKREDIKSIQG